MENYLCFDVGGTFIKFGLINTQGDLLLTDKVPTPVKNGKINIPVLLGNITKKIAKSVNINLIGVATAGMVDTEKGSIIYASDNIPGYSGAQVAMDIYHQTGIACCVENDVNAMAIGEYWRGATMGNSGFVAITLGTGVGMAVVEGGKIMRGANGLAGWGGHMIIEREGRSCTCGRRGCWEQYASVQALVRQYRDISQDKTEEIDGYYICEKMNKGDLLAERAFEVYARDVVTGLLNLSYVLDPGVIVIGGGIVDSGQWFVERLQQKYEEACAGQYLGKTILKAAHLGNLAALYGMAWICKNS